MIVKSYKTGDPCPCCGQPIKWTDEDKLLTISILCHLYGLRDENIPEYIGDPFPEVEA